MVAPFISDFGDEDHEPAETGLTVTGFDFFPGVAIQGTLWMFENADRSGASDSLPIGTHTNNSIPDVEIPASPNNADGTVYLAFQRGGDMAWSNSFQFTLSQSVTAAARVAADFNESKVVDGGGVITITLTNDTWVASGATFNAQRQNILNGISGKFFDAVMAAQAVTAVVRTSDTVVTITLAAVPSYAITTSERVTCLVPATAVTSAVGLNAGEFSVASAGGRSSKRSSLYYVEIDGEIFFANSISGVESLLARARELAEEAAEKALASLPAEQKKVRIKPPRVAVRTRSGNTTSQTIQRDLDRTRKELKDIYRRVQQRAEETFEISMLLRRKIRLEEEDAIISLLF